MPGKSPPPDDAALWAQVTATVRPLKRRRLSHPVRKRAVPAEPLADRPAHPATEAVEAVAPSAAVRDKPPAKKPAPLPPKPVQNTLDGGWDKRLARGAVAPDLAIDLHGHTLASAYAALETGLAHAVARQARLVLLVTGRPPPPGRSRLDNPLRGVIRASVGDWLHGSRFAGHIAAVRNAHPKHGGAGALYIILRRVRG